MRILVGTGLNFGAAEYQNIGDVAMLQVAVERLAELWPDAEILVLTDSPAGLARFCPAARPLPREGAETWISNNVLLGPIHRFLPQSLSPGIRRLKRSLAQESPRLLESLLGLRFRLHDSTGRRSRLQEFLNALWSADLLVICGAGGFAESCRDWNLYVLGLMDAALARGVRFALFGQGIGPLADPDILSRMRQTLPRAMMISSRGTEGAAAIARQIGIPDEVFVTTGDEAVEPAFESRSARLGDSIGVNLRIASYSGVSDSHAAALGSVLRDFARRRGTTLVPLPIALHAYADDRRSISSILEDTGVSNHESMPDSPQALYAATARCRVVVTGAYHAAVFALAQGIPVICLSASDYYAAKFNGLRALFGEGCTVLDPKETHWEDTLTCSLEKAWIMAEQLRPTLLESARSQIEASRKAYLKVRDSFLGAAQSDPPKRVALSIP